MDEREVLLDAHGLSKTFSSGRGRGRREVKAVQDVDLAIERGQTHGLVGESGSGKSTAGRILLRLIEPDAGSATFRGEDLFALEGAALRRMRRHIQMIYQDPYSSLNPRLVHRRHRGRAAHRPRAGHEGPRAGREGGVAPGEGRSDRRAGVPLPSRVLRRSAPADRHRARARARTRGSSSPTSPSPPSTSPSRRRSSTSCRTCRTSSVSPTCSSPTTSRWFAMSPTASRSCARVTSWSRARAKTCSANPSTTTRERCWRPWATQPKAQRPARPIAERAGRWR